MIAAVKKAISEFILFRKIKNTASAQVNFNKFFTDSKKVLVLTSNDENEFHFIHEVIDFLRTGRKDISVLMPDYKLNNFSNKDRLDIYTFTLNDISKLGLPVKRLMEVIATKKWDVIIDLNRGESIFHGAITGLTMAPFKIGFTKRNADRYYNFQLRQEINPKISYGNLLNSLRMF